MDCSFLIWKYRFLEDRILIFRDFWFQKTSRIDTGRIEMVSAVSTPIMRLLHRQNLVLTFAGSSFTLPGVPDEAANSFCARFEGETGEDLNESITLKPADILRLSFFQSHLVWYITILVLIWAAVIVLSIPALSPDFAMKVTDFIFRHMLVAGTLVLSIGLPYILIWLWAITGGFVREYLKFYKYTAVRRKTTLSYEYGLIIRRKFVIASDRIAITEYKQSPVMRAFGYGKLYIRAVGYNPFFLKRQPILPFLRYKKIRESMKTLVPEMNMEHKPRRKRVFRYYLFTWKWLIPLAFLIPALLLSPTFFIPMAVSALLVLGSLILEYENTHFESDRRLTVLSYGGYSHTITCVFTERIERISQSASRNKLRKGFTNVKVYVFGKSGTFARIRNVELRQLDSFEIPGEAAFRKEKFPKRKEKG